MVWKCGSRGGGRMQGQGDTGRYIAGAGRLLPCRAPACCCLHAPHLDLVVLLLLQQLVQPRYNPATYLRRHDKGLARFGPEPRLASMGSGSGAAAAATDATTQLAPARLLAGRQFGSQRRLLHMDNAAAAALAASGSTASTRGVKLSANPLDLPMSGDAAADDRMSAASRAAQAPPADAFDAPSTPKTMRADAAADFRLCWPALHACMRRAMAGSAEPLGCLLFESAAQPASAPRRSQLLEDTALVLTFGSVRLEHCHGGDGEREASAEAHNAAGFARDSGTVVTNFLLPVKRMRASVAVDTPRVAESRRLRQYIMDLVWVRNRFHTWSWEPRKVERPFKNPSEMLLDVAKANCSKLLKESGYSVGLGSADGLGAARSSSNGGGGGSGGMQHLLSLSGFDAPDPSPQQRQAMHRVRQAHNDSLHRFTAMIPRVVSLLCFPASFHCHDSLRRFNAMIPCIGSLP
eukprot:363083-Chlamydomonas_euryale.AAC.8